MTTGDMLTGEPGGKINILGKEIYMGTTGRAQVGQVNFDPGVTLSTKSWTFSSPSMFR